jgi:hypothetical protein
MQVVCEDTRTEVLLERKVVQASHRLECQPVFEALCSLIPMGAGVSDDDAARAAKRSVRSDGATLRVEYAGISRRFLSPRDMAWSAGIKSATPHFSPNDSVCLTTWPQ